MIVNVKQIHPQDLPHLYCSDWRVRAEVRAIHHQLPKYNRPTSTPTRPYPAPAPVMNRTGTREEVSVCPPKS